MERATRIRRPLRKYFFPLSLLRNKSNIMAPTLYTELRNEPNPVRKSRAKGKSSPAEPFAWIFQYISSRPLKLQRLTLNLSRSTLVSCDSHGNAPPACRLGTHAHATLRVDCPHCRLKAVAAHHDGDGQLARTLRDGDDVDTLAGNSGKDPAGKARRALHAFAHDGQQPNFFVDLDGAQVSVRQLKRQRRFQRFDRLLQFFAPDEKTETLPVTGAGERKHLDIG